MRSCLAAQLPMLQLTSDRCDHLGQSSQRLHENMCLDCARHVVGRLGSC